MSLQIIALFVLTRNVVLLRVLKTYIYIYIYTYKPVNCIVEQRWRPPPSNLLLALQTMRRGRVYTYAKAVQWNACQKKRQEIGFLKNLTAKNRQGERKGVPKLVPVAGRGRHFSSISHFRLFDFDFLRFHFLLLSFIYLFWDFG